MLSKELKVAIFQSLTGKYLVYVIQLATLAVLSRIFTPEQFGLIASAQVFVMFFQMLATSGLAPAVVYQKSVSKEMRDGVFSFTLILGVVLAVIFFAIARPLYNWFGFEEGLIVFYLLSGCVFFSSLSMMPMASLQRDARFLVIARAEVFSEIGAFIVCITAYQYLDGYTALGLRFLVVPILRFLFYYLFCADTEIGRPNTGRKINQVLILYDFAKYQVAFNILNFFSRNLDNLLVAKFFGAGMLGVYEKTYQVMRYPLQLFTFAITPALQPVLTKYKEQPEIVYKEFTLVATRLALVGLFSATVIYWNAGDIIFILFGDQWFAAVDYLKILSLSIPIQMITSSTGGVFQAFGATKAMFKCGLFSSFVSISAIIVGIYQSDLLLMCYLLVFAFSVNYIQCFYMMHRTVFVEQGIRKTLILSVLIFVVFLNLFLPGQSDYIYDGYINSAFSILTTSIILIIPLSILYFILCKAKH